MKKFERTIALVLIVATSLAALFFVIKQQMNAAILSMTILFTLTNFLRARTFKEKGHDKEARWMKKMAILFAVLSVLVVVVMITG